MRTVRVRIDTQRAPLRKPEFENVAPFLRVFDRDHINATSKIRARIIILVAHYICKAAETF